MRRPPSLSPRLLAALAVVTLVQTASAQTPSNQVASLGGFGSAAPGAYNPEPEVVVLELRIGDIASITVPGYRVGDEALIPLSAWMRLAEVQHTLHAHGTLEATFQPGNVQLIASPDHDVMSYGNRRVRIARDVRIFRGGELYVSVGALGELLQLPLEVDWADLTVRFTDPKSLPIARRVAREAARRRLRERTAGPDGPATLYALRRPPLDGLVLDYTVSAPSTDLKASRYSFAAGVNAFGGSLEGTFVGAGTERADYTASWTGVWANNDWLRQVRIGDAVSSGHAPRGQRGVTLTNSPYIRPTRFGIDEFRGMVAPRWEVEAYRAGQLVAFDSADASGRFDIPIPTEYGENPLEFVAYGPFGEVRHFNRLYRVAGELVPAGQFEYGLSAGQCVGQRCVGTGNVDLRYGVSPRWTVRAGYDAFQRDSLPMLSHPYAGIAGALTDAIGVQVDAALGARARALLRYEPSTRMRLAGEYTRFDVTDSIPILTPAGWRARWLVSALARPLGSTSGMYVEGDAAHIETISGRTLRARLITSGQWRDLRVSPYARFEQDAAGIGPTVSRSYFGVNASFFPRRSSRLFGRGWVHASFEAEQKTGLSQAAISVSRQFTRGVRIEAGGRWSRNSAAVTLLSAIDLAAVRSYTTAWLPKSGTPTTSQFLQGSIVVNTAAKGIAFEAGPSLHRSGIAGRVFLDENSNGRLDANEQLLSNVIVRVGATASESDSKGRFEVWNLTAYDPALVTVDSSSLSSPLWLPRFATMTVVPGPNRFVVVDVPIVPSGSVEGRVVLETPAGRRAVGSAMLTLIDKQTGVKQSVTTFSDGEFVAIGVRPGRYEVSVDERLLKQLQATAEPTRFTLEASADGAIVRGIEVVLRRAPAER